MEGIPIFIGLLQFAFVTLLVGGLAYSFGLPIFSSFILGAILSLSSTALVLKILSDHHEHSSPVGKKATEILVFQDIVAILLLVFLTGATTGEPTIQDALVPLGKMILAATAMIGIGRFLLKPLFKGLIAIQNDEVFTASALLIVLFTSWITQSLGLSLALGAFLGGLALSQSSYAYIVRSEVAPFRGLLLSLFFLSVGMSLNISAIISHGTTLLLFLTLFIIIKAAANWIALIATKEERSSAGLLAFLLSQGSEFAFVLLASAQQGKILDPTIVELGVAVVGLSLALTPLISSIGCRLSRSVCNVSEEDLSENCESCEVIIVEFDDFAYDIAGVLIEEGVNYRGHDRDIERLTYAKTRGFNVFFSDLNRPRTQGRASMGTVRAIVCLVEDDEVATLLINALHKISPDLPIVAATKDPKRIELLINLGIEDTFLKSKESMPLLVESLFKKLQYPEDKIQEILQRIRLSDIDDIFPRAVLDIPEETALAA